MNWATIRPALVDVVAQVTGIDGDESIKWRGNAVAGSWRRGPRITMSCRSIRSLGRDEVRLDVPEIGSPTVFICGNRKITWSLLFESESAADDGIAFEYADRFRAGIRSEAARALLRQIGLSISEIEATQILEFNSQGNPFSSANIDVQLNAVENFTDDTDGAADFIERAQYMSDELTDQAGNATVQQIDDDVTSDG